MDERTVEDDEMFSERRLVELTPEEMAFIVKVCQRHRSSIPVYLRSTRPELELIEGILKKIA